MTHLINFYVNLRQLKIDIWKQYASAVFTENKSIPGKFDRESRKNQFNYQWNVLEQNVQNSLPDRRVIEKDGTVFMRVKDWGEFIGAIERPIILALDLDLVIRSSASITQFYESRPGFPLREFQCVITFDTQAKFEVKVLKKIADSVSKKCASPITFSNDMVDFHGLSPPLIPGSPTVAPGLPSSGIDTPPPPPPTNQTYQGPVFNTPYPPSQVTSPCPSSSDRNSEPSARLKVVENGMKALNHVNVGSTPVQKEHVDHLEAFQRLTEIEDQEEQQLIQNKKNGKTKTSTSSLIKEKFNSESHGFAVAGSSDQVALPELATFVAMGPEDSELYFRARHSLAVSFGLIERTKTMLQDMATNLSEAYLIYPDRSGGILRCTHCPQHCFHLSSSVVQKAAKQGLKKARKSIGNRKSRAIGAPRKGRPNKNLVDYTETNALDDEDDTDN